MVASRTSTDPVVHARADGGDAVPGGLAPRQRSHRLEYNPALDGIRGLAVLVVMLFHHDSGGLFPGGFLAVSTFFTLSGYLITSLLLAEHHSSGRIRITGFYARRLRRLLPASAATLAVVMLTALFTTEAWERDLGGDVTASALHLANWRFLFEGQAYADLFQDSQSPVLHFWSLAIEEQFYLVFPLLTAGALVVFRGSLRAYAVVLGALVTGALALTLAFADDPDTVYYAAPIRAGEILVGSLLAVLVARGWFLGRPGARSAVAIAVAGAVGLVVQLWAWMAIPQQHWSFRWGGLLAYAASSAALVLATHVAGPVRRLMAWEPLRLLGVVSYGVYLIHWPLFRLMSESRVERLLGPFNLEASGAALLGLRLTVVLALAALSYRWIESPVRQGLRPRAGSAPLLAGGTVAGVVGLALVVPVVSSPPLDPMAEALAVVERNRRVPRSDLPANARIGIAVGDSTMVMTAAGLSSWGRESGRLVLAESAASVGCGIAVGGEVEFAGERSPLAARCSTWRDRMLSAVDEAEEDYGRVDFAVVQAGPWDVADRRLEGDGRWRHIGDPVYDEHLRREMERTVEPLLERGITVVWLTAPSADPDRRANRARPELRPARMERLNAMVHELARRDGVVTVDLAGYVAALPESGDAELRPDGIHFSLQSSREVAQWLGPEVRRAAEQEPVPRG